MAVVPFVPDQQQKRGRFVPDAPRQFVGPTLEQAGAPQQPQRSMVDAVAQDLKRGAGLNARSVAEGVLGVVNPFADAVGVIGNLPLQAYDAIRGNERPSFRFETNHAAAQGGLMDSMGVPRPETTAENVAGLATQFLAGAAASAPATAAVMGKLGLLQNTAATPVRAPSRATAPGAAVLDDAGVALDRSQRTGGRLARMVRGATAAHPATAERATQFAVQQQKQYNRAILKQIGENADEATQEVMRSAYNRIGSVFNSIGKQGAQFDDALQSEIAGVMDDALRTVPQSSLGPVQRNVDDILAAVGKDGKINGEAFIKIRSHLSELSDNADVGRVAERLEQAMLSALERTHPGQKALLRNAADQWRSMRIIQTAIGKGAERDISPLRLSNAVATRSNQAMSVYGQGGDQRLVSLAQAGRSVLPESIPNSGTAERSLMQMPLRAIATAPIYRGAQNYLLRQPAIPAPGSGVLRNALIVPTANALNQSR